MSFDKTIHMRVGAKAEMGNLHIVSASAGTGKTTKMLGDVVIDLLERAATDDQASITQSLIITFTIAAASEMRSKLRDNIEHIVYSAESPRDANIPKDLASFSELVDTRCPGLGERLAALLQERSMNLETVLVVLRKALEELPLVRISTIDALCKHIVDRNADVLEDVHPGYTILADDTIKRALRDDVANTLFEQWYDPNDEMHARFMDLLDNFGGPLKDADLHQQICSLYDQAMSKSNGIAWLDTLAEPYRPRFGETSPACEADPLLNDVLGDVVARLNQDGLLGQAHNSVCALVASHPNMSDVFAVAYVEQLYRSINEIGKLGRPVLFDMTWDELRELFWRRDDNEQTVITVHLGSRLFGKDEGSPNTKSDEQKLIKEVYTRIRAWAARWNTPFTVPARLQNRIHEIASRRLNTLVDCVKEFSVAYREAKKAQSVAEFSDVASWAWQALRDPDVLRRVNEQWKYIYVDECQDDSDLQNALILRIGAQAKKVTMVGDVKQSIYGFRGAFPEGFRELNDRVQPENRDALTTNYRSEREIISFVNSVFNPLMNAGRGGANYTEQQLKAKPVVSNDETASAEIELLLCTAADKGGTQEQSNDDRQMDMLVDRIRTLHMKDGVEYGDIAVLSRDGKHVKKLRDYLKKAGIPNSTSGVGNMLDSAEIRIAADWLRILANPKDNIAMIAALSMSGFSDDELAGMRLRHKELKNWYEILRRECKYPSAESDDEALEAKVSSFKKLLDELRQFSTMHPVSETLWHLYLKTGLYDYVGKLPNGVQRQANLDGLVHQAEAMEAAGQRGIHSFTDKVRSWMDGKVVIDEPDTPSGSDAVHISTIHKAKGLQWDTVILMNADGKLSLPSPSIIVETGGHNATGDAPCAWGGIKLKDHDAAVEMKTYQWVSFKEKQEASSLAEELRLLYVALTRAEHRLIIVGCQGSLGKRFEGEDQIDIPVAGCCVHIAYGDDNTGTMSVVGDEAFKEKPSYLRWMLQSLIVQFDGRVPDKWTREWTIDDEITLPLPAAVCEETGSDRQTQNITARLVDAAALSVNQNEAGVDNDLLRKRPNIESCAAQGTATERIPLTVNASKALEWMGGRIEQFGKHKRVVKHLPYPAFIGRQKVPPEVLGTGVHAVLEIFDWNTPSDADSCRKALLECIETLEHAERIDAPTAEKLREHKIMDGLLWFVMGEEHGMLTRRIRQHPERLHREEPFSMLLPVSKLKAWQGQEPDSGDQIVVRGIIDGYLVDDNTRAITLFDYKTDVVNNSEQHDLSQWAKRLRDEYKDQQDLYTRALEERYWGYTVTQRWLVGLDGKRLIDLDSDGIGDEEAPSAMMEEKDGPAEASDTASLEVDDHTDIVEPTLTIQSHSDLLGAKEYDNSGQLPATEKYRLMYTFDLDRFPDDSAVPTAVYSELDQQLDEDDEGWVSANILPDLVQLYELIQREIPDKYQEYMKDAGKGVSFHRIHGVVKSVEARTAYTDQPMDYDIPTGFIWPIFSAFRALLTKRDGEVRWMFDPVEIWQEVGVTLVQNTFDTSTNPDITGKSRLLWQSNYRIVETAKNRWILERLEQGEKIV